MTAEDILHKILLLYNIDENITVSSRYTITYADILYGIILTSSVEEASEILGITQKSLEYILYTKVRKLIPKSSSIKWRNFLLNLINCGYCNCCDNFCTLDNLVNVQCRALGKASLCNSCNLIKSSTHYTEHLEYHKAYGKKHRSEHRADYNARSSSRRAAKLQRTPSWANLDKIKEIYRMCPEGYHVDHIVPLQGELVSGLHVENNLQHLPASENLAKGNKFNV